MRMLSGLSLAQRSWDNFKSVFTGKSRAQIYVEKMRGKMEKLERRSTLFATELEKYKAFEIFDALEDYGDPFPLLAALEPDDANMPFRFCVGELATEYCKYATEESFCAQVPKCSSLLFEPEVCRPDKSPFADAKGTKVVSSCLRPEVVEEYKVHLAGSKTSATGKVSSV
jgi:hypothetical protein